MTDATNVMLPVRLQALQLANDFDEDADTTVTRARAYLAFLEGGEEKAKEAPPRPTRAAASKTAPAAAAAAAAATPAATAPAAAASTAPVAATQPALVPPPTTLKDVIEASKALAGDKARGGREAFVELLNVKWKCATLAQIPAEKLAHFMADLKAVGTLAPSGDSLAGLVG